jgi:hypothetical protein
MQLQDVLNVLEFYCIIRWCQSMASPTSMHSTNRRFPHLYFQRASPFAGSVYLVNLRISMFDADSTLAVN